MQQIAPRHFKPDSLHGSGLPGDRGARIAARQAFVALKLTFLQALEGLQDAHWLHDQARRAEEPVDLWLLRAPVFDALAGGDAECRRRRRMLRRGLDSVFTDLEAPSAFVPF